MRRSHGDGIARSRAAQQACLEGRQTDGVQGRAAHVGLDRLFFRDENIRCLRPDGPDHCRLRIGILLRLGIGHHDRRADRAVEGNRGAEMAGCGKQFDIGTQSKGDIAHQFLGMCKVLTCLLFLQACIKAGARDLDRAAVDRRRIDGRHHRGDDDRRIGKVGLEDDRTAGVIGQHRASFDHTAI